MKTTIRCAATIAMLFAALVLPLAHSGAGQEAAPAFELTVAMIPMRDGVRLNTHIFIPKNQREPLRTEAARLLAAHERESSFIDAPILAQAAMLKDVESLVGRSLKRYADLRRRGGLEQ